MRKFYLFLAALFAFTLSANAGTKVIYSQTYETATDVASTGWASPSAADGLSIGSDEYGKFLKFAPSGNDRSAHLLWGADLIKGAGVTAYTVSFDFSATSWGTNHANNEITLMSDDVTCTKKANQGYRANSSNWLFDLTQLDASHGGNAISSSDQIFAINGDSASTVTLTAGAFYTAILDIDTVARTVDYKLISTGKVVSQGAYQVPMDVNMVATGIYFLGSRYNPQQVFDNITVSTESDEDVANIPTVALTGVNNQQRVYTINFMDGETLHLSYNGNELDPVSYADCNGAYKWSNNPKYNKDYEGLVTDACTSGTLIVWTTSGSAKSERVTSEISNEIIAVPAPTASIAGVSEGFGKTYSVAVDNSTVPTAPQVFVSYKFIPSDGSAAKEETGLGNGAKITIPGEGTFELTSSAFGFQPTTITVVNDIEYVLAKQVDYMNWTGDQLAANDKFTKIDNTDTNSSHWIGKWMNEFTTETKNSETNAFTGIWWKAPSQIFATPEEAAAYTQIYELKNADNNYSTELLPIIPNTARENVAIFVEEGLIANTTKYNNLELTFDPAYNTDDATKPNFVIINKTGSYDRYDKQPNCHTVDVVRTDATYNLYRFDTAINSIKVMTYKDFNPSAGVQGVSVKAEANAEAPIYTISGVKVNKSNLKAGIYIQNGKKFVVK